MSRPSLRKGRSDRPVGPAPLVEAVPASRQPVAAPSLARLMALQQTVGNRAVARLLASASGRPLEPAVRADMESALGQKFDGVRVHDGGDAAAAAHATGARALTVGANVVFAAGRYAPGTREGRRLLAHELAHVVQQRRGGRPPAPGGDASLEGPAASVASAVAGGGRVATVGGSSGVGIACSEDLDLKKRLDRLYTWSLDAAPEVVKSKIVQGNQLARDAATAMGLGPKEINRLAAPLEPALRSVERFAGLAPPPRAPETTSAPQAQTQPQTQAPAPVPPPRAAEPSKPVSHPPETEETRQAKADVELRSLGLTRQQLIDDSSMTRGDLMDKYGIRGWWRISRAANKVSTATLGSVLPRPDTTVYMFPSGRQGTRADEMSHRMEEFRVHSMVGSAAQLVAIQNGVSYDDSIKYAEAGDALTGVVGSLGGAVAMRGQNLPAIQHEPSPTGRPGLAPEPWDLMDRSPAAMPRSVGEIQLDLGTRPVVNFPHNEFDLGTSEGSIGLDRGPRAPGLVPHNEFDLGSSRSLSGLETYGGRKPLDGIAPGKNSGTNFGLFPGDQPGTAASGFQLDPNRPNGVALPHNEFGLEPAAGGIDLGFGVGIPSNAPQHNQFDFGLLGKKSGLKTYGGSKPLDKIPDVKRTRPTFGVQSDEKAGTEHRTGTEFHEYNAAEIERGLRIDRDPVSGITRSVTYRTDADAVRAARQTERNFSGDSSTQGAQSRDSAYVNSGKDRGHLAAREAFKGGSAEAEQAADLWTNVVPMTPGLNQEHYRALEIETNRLAEVHGSVTVTVKPIYDANPPRLSDGTPIPRQIQRVVRGSDGKVLISVTLDNK